MTDLVGADLDAGYEVVIVGSGAAGSTLAYQLAQHGRRVLVVERGSELTPRRRRSTEPIGEYLVDVAGTRRDCLSFVGGQTKFYGAALYRLRERDFEAVEHESGVSPAWPITYANLERYYQQAETLYRVHGSAAGDATEPPRTVPYPYPPIPHSPLVAEVVKRLEASGTPVSSIPLALDYGPGGRCVLCSTCDAHYCQIDAKMDAETAALRPAIATGHVQLATETECVRVLTNATGTKTTGVVLRRADGERVVAAEAVAVCGGIPGSATLLRRSRTDQHPAGLGNDWGCLGKYLAGHSVGMVFPIVSWRRVPPSYTKSFAVNSYYNRGPDWPYPLGTIQMAGQMPFWQALPVVARSMLRRMASHTLMCFYMAEALPTPSAGFVFDGDEIVGREPPLHNWRSFAKLRELSLAMFRRAGYPALARRRRPYVWHEVGVARFGQDPATSVVDPNCQIHGIEGLFVVDASVLPSAGAVNTGLTIMALALRAGDYIAGQLGWVNRTAT